MGGMRWLQMVPILPVDECANKNIFKKNVCLEEFLEACIFYLFILSMLDVMTGLCNHTIRMLLSSGM
jgi:hypothetical protein